MALQDLSDGDLCLAYQAGSERAVEALLARFQPMLLSCCRAAVSTSSTRSVDATKELWSIAAWGLCKGAKSWRPEGAFVATWLQRHVTGELLRWRRKQRLIHVPQEKLQRDFETTQTGRVVCSVDDVAAVRQLQRYGYTVDNEAGDSEKLRAALSTLTPQQRYIVEARSRGLMWEEVGAEMARRWPQRRGIARSGDVVSKQWLIALEKKAMAKLRKQLL